MGKGKIAIVWFRNDLRIRDNEALVKAAALADSVLPVYVLDHRFISGVSKHGIKRSGSHRISFLLESLRDLKLQLRAHGSDLLIRQGNPEELIYKLAARSGAAYVICNRERTFDEELVQDALEEKLWKIGAELLYTRGKMLFHTQDLPFPVNQTPDIFSNYRKEVEHAIQVREPLDVAVVPLGKIFTKMEFGKVPDLLDLGFEQSEVESRPIFPGGETEALRRLQYYVWDTGLITKYKQTRDQLLGLDYSSKLSPYLALGCISPKTVYWEISKYEEKHKANSSTYWLKFELLWRDFFRLMGKKHKVRIFLQGGPKGLEEVSGIENREKFEAWCQGCTGVPFIDANMRELNSTGYMSNRGRQNVASFLIHDLKLNWQLGAEYFEKMLIDYDPCSNYGNWNYLAGVGSDPRVDRHFNILAQAKKYDPQGEYVRYWVPELDRIPGDKVLSPEMLTETELLQYGVVLGRDYPCPIIDTCKWVS